MVVWLAGVWLSLACIELVSGLVRYARCAATLLVADSRLMEWFAHGGGSQSVQKILTVRQKLSYVGVVGGSVSIVLSAAFAVCCARASILSYGMYQGTAFF